MKILAPLLVALSATSLMISCSEPPPQDPDQIAADLAQNTIIIDTHVDVPYRLNDIWEDISEATEGR